MLVYTPRSTITSTRPANSTTQTATKSILLRSNRALGLASNEASTWTLTCTPLAPTLVWVTDLKSLGMKYGALISPTFVNANFNAEIEALRGRGGSVSAGGRRGGFVRSTSVVRKVGLAFRFRICVRV